ALSSHAPPGALAAICATKPFDVDHQLLDELKVFQLPAGLAPVPVDLAIPLFSIGKKICQ
ncbi:hypothetical protein, partial [Caldimonas tepidiphila]|uniref:hypothetical protein n=1 Tax=Caldimonas tepidiphila TaxID=2315841 RepID=UPI00196B6C36